MGPPVQGHDIDIADCRASTFGTSFLSVLKGPVPGLRLLSLRPFSKPWGLLAGSPVVCGARSVFPFAACLSAVGRAVWLLVPLFLSSVSGREVYLLYPRDLDQVDGPARALLPGRGRQGCTWPHPPRGQEGGCCECSPHSSCRSLRFAECPSAQRARRHKVSDPARGRAVQGVSQAHTPFPEKVLASPGRPVLRVLSGTWLSIFKRPLEAAETSLR